MVNIVNLHLTQSNQTLTFDTIYVLGQSWEGYTSHVLDQLLFLNVLKIKCHIASESLQL